MLAENVNNSVFKTFFQNFLWCADINEIPAPFISLHSLKFVSLKNIIIRRTD